MNYVIKNLHYTLTVSDLGAEIISLKSNTGTELIWQSPNEKLWNGHAPLLFPVCGQLKDKSYIYCGKKYDMSGHGFAKKSVFTPILINETKIVLSIKSNKETREIYPFDFTLTATYELDGNRVLFSAIVKNDGDVVLPYMFGWHPGFVLPSDKGQKIEDYKLKFSDCKNVSWTPLQHTCFARPYGEDYPLVDSAYRLCEKEIYENDTMIFSNCKNSVRLAADVHPFSLDMTWSDNLPYLCVWKAPYESAKFICLEPWTGTPNDGEAEENFETRKMERLSPNDVATYSYTLKFSF